MGAFKSHTLWLVLAVAGTAFIGCHKHEHHPGTGNTGQSYKWDTIAGHYQVFDTVGVYLYDMDLIHIHNDSTGRDSIRFENFDGQFTFTAQQENFVNIPMYVAIGSHNLLYDTNGKRWKLFGGTYSYYNNFHDDTIPLRFDKTNINYYIEDATPYSSCDCKQIAVKQH